MCEVVIFCRRHRNFIWGWRFVSGYLGGISKNLKKLIFEILVISEVIIFDYKNFTKKNVIDRNTKMRAPWAHTGRWHPKSRLDVMQGTTAVCQTAIRHSYSATGGSGDGFYNKITIFFVKNQSLAHKSSNIEELHDSVVIKMLPKHAPNISN